MDYSKLGQAAAASEDMTQDAVFERKLPRAGIALLRLRDYVELGRHESKNPTHKPSLKALLTFELSHPEHMIEVDGKKVPDTMTVRVNKGTTKKSGFRKLFKVMNKAHDDQFKHMVQMVGKAFLGEVFHNTSGEGDKAKTYANLDFDGTYSLKAPVQVDALTNTDTPIPVAELHETPKVFLWEAEGIEDDDIKEMWESIYIEGEKEVTDKDGNVTKKSKNWIQETIRENIEWEGSTTQALVDEHISLDDLEGVDTSNVGTTNDNNVSAVTNNVDLAAVAEGLPSLDD